MYFTSPEMPSICESSDLDWRAVHICQLQPATRGFSQVDLGAYQCQTKGHVHAAAHLMNLTSPEIPSICESLDLESTGP